MASVWARGGLDWVLGKNTSWKGLSSVETSAQGVDILEGI